jgi:hypothetical protein
MRRHYACAEVISMTVNKNAASLAVVVVCVYLVAFTSVAVRCVQRRMPLRYAA